MPAFESDVVLGSASPNLDRVRSLVEGLGHSVELHVDTPHMSDLMAQADIAVGAGGSSSWERCCLGLPSLVIVIANNQVTAARHLAEHKAAKVLWDADTLSSDMIAVALDEILHDTALRRRMINQAAELVDGKGTRRVIQALNAQGPPQSR